MTKVASFKKYAGGIFLTSKVRDRYRNAKHLGRRSRADCEAICCPSRAVKNNNRILMRLLFLKLNRKDSTLPKVASQKICFLCTVGIIDFNNIIIFHFMLHNRAKSRLLFILA